jgi:hypothetical protein
VKGDKMTVKELIDKLKMHNPEDIVHMCDSWWDEYETDDGWHEEEISIDKEVVYVDSDSEIKNRVNLLPA